ncbi:2OG-Fe(II) oxygenase [Aestuariibacter sp. GS-14]|uniref:2OG-Fe(II) oxygenase n=1 Tax=Aestuariibacter sp. GS-14 TaxID=2590670 RepID=UPI00112C1518|nr:2OG-Fe(II) oxygenase [Aestuariibacter sp. GS-14]TPV60917.1 2OG-Fe(II) oxygenase [Aestuariibacter sp. GS-14]
MAIQADIHLTNNQETDNTPSFSVIADDIRAKGFSIQHGVLPPGLLDALAVRAQQLHRYDPAGIGREQQFQQNQFVRTDEICWIDGTLPETQEWLTWTTNLKTYLNRHLFLGLFSFESHFAHYPPGSFYKKHYDAFQGEANRVLSVVLYLNSNWAADEGGELVIYSQDNADDTVTVTPLMGTMVIFLSEEFPHEVLPATRDRFSIAGWFRVNNSTAQRVDPPK